MASNRVMGSIGALARTARPSAVASTSRAASRASSSVASVAATPTKEVELNEDGLLVFPKLQPLPAPEGVHVATVHLRAYHPTNLDLYSEFAAHTARSLRIPTSGIVRLPTTKELNTVLKSPFVHKKAQQNFERKTHRRTIKVFDTEREVLDLYLRYLRRNGIAGVGIKAYVHEYVEYGFARGEIAELEGQVKGKDAAELEKATAEIVKALSQGLEFDDEPKAVDAPEAKREEKLEKVEAEKEAEKEDKLERVQEEAAEAEAAAEPAAEAPKSS
ncbi:mitochondrial 37S ribosomal protein rsm10 [Vanrija albida]|uniref:Mitochondrial 37S ribosomal protein rsm10 n=1 Tax=Vanrija albida TaxID=181172 RepID=A0ABR3PS02_9TREE